MEEKRERGRIGNVGERRREEEEKEGEQKEKNWK